MKASELRIGNLVKPIRGDFESNGMWNHENKAFYTNNNCVEITALGLVDIENKNVDVYPIELTEEWLLKFGFEWSIYHQAYHKDGFHFDLNCNYKGGYTLDTFKRLITLIIDIKYVHQLQNLYFALTGNELNINI